MFMLLKRMFRGILFKLFLIGLGILIGIFMNCYESPIIRIAQQKVMVICTNPKDTNWVELECRCQDVPVRFQDIVELPGCKDVQ